MHSCSNLCQILRILRIRSTCFPNKETRKTTKIKFYSFHHWFQHMDQTPIFFYMLPRTTLNVSGARTVHVRTCTASTMRVTVSLTVTASGDMLAPLFVFKGKSGGRTEREFRNYGPGGIYSVQEKAWMDQSIMMNRIENVLKPYVLTAPSGIQPILFLDSYRCHMMSSVVGAIENLGVQVEHIPGGCTGLCQPIGVAIGKPLKNTVRRMWEVWMVEQGQSVRYTPPTSQTVATWVVTAVQQLSSEKVGCISPTRTLKTRNECKNRTNVKN
jgi:hypothetical protein